MGNMCYVPTSPQNRRVSFIQKCSIHQDYECNLTWDGTALVMAATLMFGGCEMRLGGDQTLITSWIEVLGLSLFIV
jgi:hypothetical protein